MEIMEELEVKTSVQDILNNENKMGDVCTVILKVNNAKLGVEEKTYNLKLFGKTFLDWAKNSVFDTTIRYADYNFGDDFLPVVKNAADTRYKYTFVLFADTPLFQHKTFLQIMEYFKMKNLSVLKLTRGYVFETKYLIEIEQLLNPQVQYFDEEDFITCSSLKQYAMISDIMKNRILSYHMKNGVLFKDPTTTFVDADVQIGKDTVIEPFCQIYGKTIVESNVKIGSNSKIENSVICSGANINGAVISDSLIEKNVVIEEFAKISNNSKIAQNAKVPPHCIIKNAVVDENCDLKSFMCYVGE